MFMIIITIKKVSCVQCHVTADLSLNFTVAENAKKKKCIAQRSNTKSNTSWWEKKVVAEWYYAGLAECWRACTDSGDETE